MYLQYSRLVFCLDWPLSYLSGDFGNPEEQNVEYEKHRA